jgi:hypothetical protein
MGCRGGSSGMGTCKGAASGVGAGARAPSEVRTDAASGEGWAQGKGAASGAGAATGALDQEAHDFLGNGKVLASCIAQVLAQSLNQE